MGLKDCIFLQEWWWEAVCPQGAYRTLQAGTGDKTARWRLAEARRMKVFSVLSNPPLTQHSGPDLSKRALFKELLLQIPPNANLRINLGFSLEPEEKALCHQLGIHTAERTTYRINDLSDIQKTFAQVDKDRRRQIRKMQALLQVVENPRIEDLLRLQKDTFRRQNLRLPYPEDSLLRIYEAVKQHHAGELVALADAENRIVSCGLFVYDNQSCYALASGHERNGKTAGAGSLLKWKGIEIAASKGLIFDFEGSDIEKVAEFNKSFGAKPFTYTCLERYNRVFQALDHLKTRLKI